LISSRISLPKSELLLWLLVLSFGLIAETNSVLGALKGQSGGDFRYKHYNDEGKVLWLIEGKKPTFGEDLEVTILKPKLVIVQASGNALLTSNSATYDTAGKLCSLSGNVTVNNFSEAFFQGDDLKVLLKDRSLSFSSPFQARQGPLSLSASKGRFFSEDQRFETEGKTQVEYLP
jgi:LPS export ABC transporter protein LptC